MDHTSYSNPLFVKKLKLFLPSLMGTIVEYYDYALYGFCAAFLATHFFPQNDPTVALLQTYGIFAIGSFAKPLGAFVFGQLGDRKGRRVSLRFSMFGIAIPTTLIGILPGYAEWGWVSALILLGCRFSQGFFVHGEHDGVRLFVLEHVGENRPCLASSLVWVSCSIGIYLASLAAYFVTLSTSSGAWRVPFLVAGSLGIVVQYFRKFITETPEYLEYQARSRSLNTQQLVEKKSWAIIRNWKGVLATIMHCGAIGGGYHFCLVFLGTYLSKTLHMIEGGSASFYTSCAVLIFTVTLPFGGLTADHFGLKRTLFTSFLTLMIVSIFNTFMIAQNEFSLPLMGATVITLAFFSASGYVLLARQFSVEERFRCVSMGHALGSMIFSGSTPMICTFLWHKTQMPAAPLIYFMGLSIMGIIAVFICKDRRESAKEILQEDLPFRKSA